MIDWYKGLSEEEIAMGEPVHQAEEYIEVEEGELIA